MSAPLVYPRQLPRQVPSSDKYIDQGDNVETKVIDYLKIQIYNTQGENGANPYNWAAGGGGFKEPFKGLDNKSLYKTIYLYLPTGIKENYQAQYNEASLGAIGAGALQGLQGDMNPVEALQKTAGTVKPEFVMNTAASALGTVNSSLGLNNSMDAGGLTAIATKKIFNPYAEVTFKGVNYREHLFNFKMAPRNIQEAKECREIIECLRRAMLPASEAGDDAKDFQLFNSEGDKEGEPNAVQQALTSESGTISGARWLTIPDIFRLSLVRVRADDAGDDTVKLQTLRPKALSEIVKFPTKCVLTQMDVDVTPDGQYNSLKGLGVGNEEDYGPAAMTLQLSFKETSFITRDMI